VNGHDRGGHLHRWIVLRGSAIVEGRWMDLDRVGVDPDTGAEWVDRPGDCFQPTDRFERRESDGVTGRVYQWSC
jgi:hypothetical protein